MVEAATLVLFCGLPGSGKTTLARRLSAEGRGIRLNTDEWMAALGFDPMDGPVHEALRTQLWRHAQDLLAHGHDVVLEDGLWTRDERDARRNVARKMGCRIELHVLDVPSETLFARLAERNAVGRPEHARVEEADLQHYLTLFDRPGKTELMLFDAVEVYS